MSTVVSVSPAFRKSAIKAIFSIVLFIAAYLFIVFMALGVTLLCAYWGLQIILLKPSAITLLLGAGIISFGVLILIFVVKFIFKQNKADTSGMIQITGEEQPEIFAFIRDIVQSTGTHFPKRIYISADVNASVFYDSSMLSMFLPVKKNLNIGLGLINTVNKSELKAVLAHEFGHFSQRSMKIGSYMYHVNRIIYNLLYENDSYESIIGRWSGIHGFVSIFVMMAVKTVKGIQWCLSKIYHLVNIHYRSLSRAMEFHADEVAASVAGSKPLITSLMRMSLAEHSYGEVLRFYGNHIQDGYRTTNIYPSQKDVMAFVAGEYKVDFVEGFPHVTPEVISHFNKSKLVIRNQWASHPETEERVENLNRVNAPCHNYDHAPAGSLFNQIHALEKQLTTYLFINVDYTDIEFKETETDSFMLLYQEEFKNNNFPEGYGSFYDYHNPHIFDLEQVSVSKTPCQGLASVFTPALGEFAAETHALNQDAQVIRKIAVKEISVKSFDYDGQKYTRKQAGTLATQLEQELEKAKEKLKQTDLLVYSFFVAHATSKGRLIELKEKYRMLFAVDQQFDEVNSAYVGIRQATQFLQYQLSKEELSDHLARLRKAESPFRKQISEILSHPGFSDLVHEKARQELETYMNQESNYFNGNTYSDASLRILFAAINQYENIASNVYFHNKQKLLRFQEELAA